MLPFPLDSLLRLASSETRQYRSVYVRQQNGRLPAWFYHLLESARCSGSYDVKG